VESHSEEKDGLAEKTGGLTTVLREL
jgi:hypothetical protein